MFVQVISGRVADPEGLHRQLDRWVAELQEGATGHLGATAGVTADGRAIMFARFESEAAARANSDRPEQGQWWADTEKYFESVRFEDSSDVEEWRAGSDDAGFVQFMRAKVQDRARLAEVDAALEAAAPDMRPDIIGGLRVWTGPDTYVEAAYFTTEAEARAGESKAMPAELQQVMADWENLLTEIEYFDITDPWLYSP
jgi:hypothetical protein